MGINEGGNNIIYVVSTNLSSEPSECMDYGYRLWLSWQNVMVLAPWVLILTVISFIAARHLNAQELGDDIAVGLGVPLTKSRVFMLLLSTAFWSSCLRRRIGFVGLMAPHISRRLVGSLYGALLPVAAIVGAILVLAADLIGRTIFTPLEIPAGYLHQQWCTLFYLFTL